ncbi:MAG: hypothetical protein WCX28_09830 [Bacteriovoracaceae bacterium]
MKYLLFLFLIAAVSVSLLSQDEEKALQTQRDAIVLLSSTKGFTAEALNDFLMQRHGKALSDLTRKQAAETIMVFQSENAPQPPATAQKLEQRQPIQERQPSVPQATGQNGVGQILAQFLEEGMSKRFHLVDGNIIQGTIVKIESGICQLQTQEGILKIPTADILEETAEISKRDDSRYVGPVINETVETISIRSKYGDVVIDKKEIRDMNRYHGGKLVPWAEEKKRFYRSQVSLTDIFMDATAFPLEANAMYISGLSIGYGFTENFMVRTSFGNNFNGDLNLKPMWQFYHDRSATQRTGIAMGLDLYSRHDMRTVLANYTQYIQHRSTKKAFTDQSLFFVGVDQAIKQDYKNSFYAEIYLVYSKLWSLESGRGEMGYHFGVKTSTLPFIRGNMLDTAYQWTSKNMNALPFRLWCAFEYDLTKNLKFAASAWADNGYRYRTLSEVRQDYISDGTPFTLDAKGGEYRLIDFDFGFLYAVNDSFRFGVHFKEAYFVFFWRILEL